MLSEVLRQHLRQPRNAGQPPGRHRTAEVRNPVCGDLLHLHLVPTAAGRLRLMYQAQACSAVLAFLSWATEHLGECTRDELERVDVNSLVTAAGGLPPGKQHAADMLSRALRELLETP